MTLMNNPVLRHNDQDLVQLAGYHAYEGPQERDELKINGRIFRVEHVLKTTESGLDAFTVRNITPLQKDCVKNEDAELIIV